eukprot:COSAG05_NODE_2645_length_2807_cov_1752.380724_1_plen_65_part_00
MAAVDIRGRGGRRLSEAWEAGPKSYLGLQVPPFPQQHRALLSDESDSEMTEIYHMHAVFLGICV